MTHQPIIRYVAQNGHLQRLELTADSWRAGDYRVTKVNTPYRKSGERPLWNEGDRLYEGQLNQLTSKTPLEACESEVARISELLRMSIAQRDDPHNPIGRNDLNSLITTLSSDLAHAQGLLERQAALSAHEWYWVTDQWVIQIEQPMAANDSTRDMMNGASVTYPMMSGYVTTLAGVHGRSEWFHGEVATFDPSLESAISATLESIFPNLEDLGAKWSVNEIKNVLKMTEAAVLAKGLPVVALSPSKYVGKTYEQWHPFTRSDVCGDADVEAISAWMRFGSPERFEEAAKMLRELV